MNSETLRKTVEQFHLLFLNQLGQKLDKRLYALKGGCNLRFYFNSIRYSEDMDLDVQVIASTTLRNKVNQILNADSFHRILMTRNIILRLYSEPKQTETTQRWKLDLRLPNSAISINTRLEFSRREQIETAVFEPIQTEILQNYQLMPILSSHYPANPAYQQKIRALALRQQTQARDVFDLYLLQGNSNLKLNITPNEVILLIPQAQSRALSISFSDFKGQVLAYLPFEYQQQYNDPQLWDLLVLKVCENLEKVKNASC
jgi:predicted nucleotidyltransferase component of viral defense system